MSLFDKHKDFLNRAIHAVHERTFYAAYPELPKQYGEEAMKQGEEAYKNYLNNNFGLLLQKESDEWYGEEVSPYTQQPLGVRYPFYKTDDIIIRSKEALMKWKKISPGERAGILIESLEKMKSHFFDIAYATQHTTGQSWMMSFQASGPHAADRALEPIAIGYQELKRFPEKTLWEKPMGKFSVKLEKTFTPVPRGIGLVIGCSTFPVWNSLPAIYADLIAGNTVIVKPHPKAVLPIAICVAAIQHTFKENNIDVHTIQLAADTSELLMAKKWAEHPDVKVIDYTGSSAFGDYLEALQNKVVFTEKAGVNSVILDSVNNIDEVMQNLSFSVSLYSGQMCTAPQNFFIPASGVKAADKVYTYDEVVQKLKDAVVGLVNNPKMGAGVLGAIQNENTIKRIEKITELKGKMLLESSSVTHAEFADSRTVSPVMLEAHEDEHTIYENELFGPIIVAIKTKDTANSVELAKELAQQQGAITCAAYTTDENIEHMIEEEMMEVFVPVTFNLTGPIWVNQHAAFSDFHVTGGNKAGNATLTNPEYVIKRFVWVGNRKMIV